ncbi:MULTISPECIES: isochorismatase family cysteine hydrolase [unclassified Leptolyngbya]|uniref:cysteine hydrolase family protein n=1 Tax=unclassified Leptolyngbya TaxID=2650499 RepID=UPI0016837F61|nr:MULTISPECIES: isochorismatase family cysteine hydrolase [unclassified Leptolyngbya]MBD1912949.1 cysteine hydrolase [Leptolyngbya sp. FACHB-8]MBD2154722.1 cysteine hydrolase [Leptolyngbya sp. FACHB-16]
MTIPLLVVDVQTGFINDFTHHIPKRVARLIEQKLYSPVLFTRFINAADGPYTRLLQWNGCHDAPETDLSEDLAPYIQSEFVFSKPGLCGMPSELVDYLCENQVQQIAVVGIDTDMCVLKIAMDLFDQGIEPIVLTDCCASTAGLQAHLAGLAVLSRNIGAQRLRDAGLGEGTLAAPVAK